MTPSRPMLLGPLTPAGSPPCSAPADGCAALSLSPVPPLRPDCSMFAPPYAETAAAIAPMARNPGTAAHFLRLVISATWCRKAECCARLREVTHKPGVERPEVVRAPYDAQELHRARGERTKVSGCNDGASRRAADLRPARLAAARPRGPPRRVDGARRQRVPVPAGSVRWQRVAGVRQMLK